MGSGHVRRPKLSAFFDRTSLDEISEEALKKVSPETRSPV